MSPAVQVGHRLESQGNAGPRPARYWCIQRTGVLNDNVLSGLIFQPSSLQGLAASWTILRHLDLSSADRSKRSPFKPFHFVIVSSHHALGLPLCRRPEVVPVLFFLQETSLFPQYVPKVRQLFYLNFFLTIMRCINLHTDSHLPTRYRADHLMISGTLERC